MFKGLLTTIERNKNKIIKFFILCSAIKFISSLLYRIYSNEDSRTQYETTINIYSILFIGLVFIQEFLPCFVLNAISENMHIITHHRGKGIIFILVSLIYTSPTMDDQQNYSAYLLLIIGVILMFVNDEELSNKSSPAISSHEKNKNEENKSMENVITQTKPIPNQVTEAYLTVNSNKEETTSPKKSFNPYDIPDDF